MEFELDGLRLLLAFICGFALCLSGSLTQIISSNPLASPSTLGFDGLVVLFVLMAHLIISINGEGNLAYISFGIFMASLVLLVPWLRSGGQGQRQINMNYVILLGLGFNLLVGAIFSVVQFLFMAMNLQFPSGLWFGNFRGASWEAVLILLPLFLGAIFWSWKLAKALSIMSIDGTVARSLGVEVGAIQKRSLFLALFLTAGVICFFGVFSFLGLIFPHLMRSFHFFRGNVKLEIYLAPILAGLLLAALDQLCYNLNFYGAELPVGMVSSVLGSLLLVIIVIQKSLKN